MVPALLAVLDGSVTLIGQPPAYWAGDHSQFREGTPGFRILLRYGPMAYVAGLAVWVVAFVGLMRLLTSTLTLAVCLMFTLGHAIGAFSWINTFPNARGVPVFINAAAALGLAFGIRRGWACSPRDDEPMGGGLPIAARWVLIAVLCSVPILYTWPR